MKHRIAIVALVALALTLMLAGVTLAADDTTKQVGLVVAFPDNTEHVAVVTVPMTATTFDVLQAAKVDLVSQSTSFGPALCSIKTVGCPASNCFCDAQHFWAYYHLTDGAWVAAAEGVGAFVPADGAVEGFAWSGFDASFNPTFRPTVYTFAQITAAPQPATLPKTGGSLLFPAIAGSGGLLLAAGLIAYRSRPGRKPTAR